MSIIGLILAIMIGLVIVGFAFRVLTGILRLFVTAVGIVIFLGIIFFILSALR